MSLEIYREMFVEEANELFDSANNILLEVEKTGELTTDNMNQLFRDVHTLKGSGSSVELKYFSKFTHEMENFMDKLRNKEISFDISMTNDLINNLDLMQELLKMEIENEITDEIFENKTKEPIKKIKEILNLNENKLQDTKISENSQISENKEVFYGLYKNKKDIPNQKYIKLPKIEDSNIQPTKEISTNKRAIPRTSENIRVDLSKIDMLMNNVGELVITNAMLKEYILKISDDKIIQVLSERVNLLERHIREMQDSIMSIRMVPMQFVYQKFPKMIRDTAKKVSKEINFENYGEGVEIDKTMIEGLTDPLMHIVRNSIDHGIEPNGERGNKPKIGTIKITAEQTNGQIIITIEDDGQGINTEKVVEKAIQNKIITLEESKTMSENEKAMLIFSAGLSTADSITDISGRGVGMDVVKTNIEKLEGNLSLETQKGIGTKIKIELPLTLAILDGLEVAVGKENFIIPLSSIIESLQPTENMVNHISEGEDILTLREEFIPIIKLYEIFDIEPKHTKFEDGIIVVTKVGNVKIGLFIDTFLKQSSIVVKPLDKNFKKVEGISAATVSGIGSILLILDIDGIIKLKQK